MPDQVVAIGLETSDKFNEIACTIWPDGQDFWRISAVVDDSLECVKVVGVGDLFDRIPVSER
jgi:hypothetical protein